MRPAPQEKPPEVIAPTPASCMIGHISDTSIRHPPSRLDASKRELQRRTTLSIHYFLCRDSITISHSSSNPRPQAGCHLLNKQALGAIFPNSKECSSNEVPDTLYHEVTFMTSLIILRLPANFLPCPRPFPVHFPLHARTASTEGGSPAALTQYHKHFVPDDCDTLIDRAYVHIPSYPLPIRPTVQTVTSLARCVYVASAIVA